MALSLKQKRALLKLTEPLGRGVCFVYRVVDQGCLHRFRIPSLVEGVELSQSDSWPRSILVVRLDSIGDVLLSEPAISALRRRFPESKIDVVAGEEGKAILERNPAINSFVIYNAPWHAVWRGRRVSWISETRALWKVLRTLRKRRYDLVFELRGDVRDIAFALATGAIVKVGSGWRGGGYMLDSEIPYAPCAHRVDFALSIVGVVGAPTIPKSPRLHLSPEEQTWAERILPQSDSLHYIAFHLGAGFPNKCLPVDKFAQVASHIFQGPASAKRRLVLVGGKKEKELAAVLVEQLPFEPINLVGETNVTQTAAVLQRCRIFIGNDSAPMHLAAASGVPVVTFFGPSEPEKYHPYGVEYRLLEVDLPCRPCDHVHCVYQDPQCMAQIEVGDIVAAAEDLIAKASVVREKTSVNVLITRHS